MLISKPCIKRETEAKMKLTVVNVGPFCFICSLIPLKFSSLFWLTSSDTSPLLERRSSFKNPMLFLGLGVDGLEMGASRGVVVTLFGEGGYRKSNQFEITLLLTSLHCDSLCKKY